MIFHLAWELREEEEQKVIEWLNDAEVCKYNSHFVFPAKPLQPDGKTLRFGLGVDHKLVGVVSLQKIDWVNRSAELAILIGDTTCHGKGVGKHAALSVCRHGFNALNLHRIYCGTHQDNIGMQKVAEAVGMTFEGKSRQAMYKNGQYADVWHYGILKAEFEARFNADSSDIERAGNNTPHLPG